MSYSLAVADGDLVQNGSQLSVVYGVDKLRQDVNCWMMETLGCDRFHSNYGAALQDYIGGVVSGSTKSQVQAEVLRVLQNYQTLQVRRFKENPEKMSGSELMVSVDDISVKISYDTVYVTIKLRNGTQQYTTIKVATSTV